jgi:hypothetical protein
MKAKSIKGNSAEEIKTALEQSMTDGFKPTLAIVFLSVKQDRDAICKILDDAAIAIYGATTNDIIGGNSGSPLINAKGEVIGAIFDGNIHSLGGEYFFDPKLNRTVSVSTAAMTEALIKVYGRNGLVAELTAP